jgi:hypothetical protein
MVFTKIGILYAKKSIKSKKGAGILVSWRGAGLFLSLRPARVAAA